MIRKAFLMTLRPGQADDYEQRHKAIWPALATVLNEHGVHNYSIFLDRLADKLFAYAEIESEERWEAVSQTEVCQRWWRSLKELMLTNSDDSPLTVALEEVFHLD
jgi:L-rhamnose mutarotase